MILRGEKIYIKSISEKDTDLIIKWRNDINVRKNFISQQQLTKNMHEDWLKKVYAGEVAQFIIIDACNETPLGSVFLRDIDRLNKKAEFGIFIGEDESRGKGFGNQAALLILKYGFEELNLNKIFLRVLSDNVPAINSYKKAGFIQDGIFREDVFIDNKYRDILFMSILKADWGKKYDKVIFCDSVL